MVFFYLCFLAGGLFANYSNESTLNEADVIAASGNVDSFCAAISAVAPLDLMPGCKDPAGIMLPQKPFHYCKQCLILYWVRKLLWY